MKSYHLAEKFFLIQPWMIFIPITVQYPVYIWLQKAVHMIWNVIILYLPRGTAQEILLKSWPIRELRWNQKLFAVGLRLEHPQKLINNYMYGSIDTDNVPAADYKVTAKCNNGRGVYSFCMCPGGYVVNASSEPGMLCVNGMSYSGRDGCNANSAIVVTVSPEDFGGNDILDGMHFQRNMEKAAFNAAAGKVPYQLNEDFQKALQANRYRMLSRR